MDSAYSPGPARQRKDYKQNIRWAIDEPGDVGDSPTKNPAKQRNVLSAALTVAGRIDTAS